MKIGAVLVSTIVGCIGQFATGCEFPRMPLSDWVSKSEEIFVGKITLVNVPQLGTESASEESQKIADTYNFDLIVWADSVENIAGVRADLVAHIDGCGGSNAEMKPNNMAIFFNLSGEWYAREYSSELVETVRALSNQSNTRQLAPETTQNVAPNL